MEKILRAALAALLFIFTPLWGDGIINDDKGNADLTQEKTYQENEFNRLNWIEVSQGSSKGSSIQLLFDFTQPVYFKKKFIAEAYQLRLSFPGMHLQHFDKKQVISKLNKLKVLGLVSRIDLFEKTTKYPKVVLTIDFEKTRQIKQEDDTMTTVTNSLLIKWCKMEEPNRLVFDIFTQESLKKIQKNDTGILYAHNSTLQTDTPPPLNRQLTEASPENFRIVIDAGHGGSDNGAQGFGLKEKDLALDIALRTRSILKNGGLSAFLTRNSDEDISLSARTEFAHQLKADLFVSIHINSGGPGGEQPSGLEIFHLNPKQLVTPSRDGGFLFINLEKNMEYAAAIDKQLQEKTNFSHKLATNIQLEVLSVLRTKNKAIVNRGVKKEHFRIFFNSASPTALVEVGFITNQKEAKLLATAEYRQLIAQGICTGIKKYVTAYKNRLN